MASYLPPLPESPAAIAEGYGNVYGAFAAMGAGNAVVDVAMLSEFADAVVADNYSRYPAVSRAAADATGSAFGALNDDLLRQYYASLDYINPGWRDKVLQTSVDSGVDAAQLALEYGMNILPQAMASSFGQFQQAHAANTAILNGQLPADMMYQARMFAAEQADRFGVFGQAASNMQVKGVATTSLQAQTEAMNQISSIFGLALDPAAKGMQLMGQGLNTLGATAATIKAYMPPTADLSSLFTQNLSALTGTTLQSPNNIISGMGSMQGTLLNAAQGAWSSVANFNNNAYVSQLNAAAAAQNKLIMQGAQGGNLFAGILGGVASGASTGAAFGLPGIIIGGVAGGALGGVASNQS